MTGQMIPSPDIGERSEAGSLALLASLYALVRKGAKEAWETEHHFHTYSHMCGIASGHDNDPSNPCCDVDSTTAFVVTSGDDNPGTGSWVYGAWLCIIGNSDLPIISGSTYYDPHLINIVDVSAKNVEMNIQLAYGATSEAATTNAGLGFASSHIFAPLELKTGDRVVEIPVRRAAVTMPLWARLASKGLDGATVGFFSGLHEYTDPDV